MMNTRPDEIGAAYVQSTQLQGYLAHKKALYTAISYEQGPP